MSNLASGEVQLTDVPARLEQLKWSRWHTKIDLLLFDASITAVLGAGWALDAYEINIVSAVLNLLKEQFKVTSQQATYIKTVWLAGALVGALGFGYFLYGSHSFLAIGVGAEYTARGGVNTLVMSTWAIGALCANLIQIPLVKYVDPDLCWRIGMGSGAVAAICVFWFRRALPESPRWYLSQGRFEEAEAVVAKIETLAGQPLQNSETIEKMVYDVPKHENFFGHFITLFVKYPGRTVYAMILNGSRAFGNYGVAGFMSLAILPLAKILNENMPTFYLWGNVATVPAGLLNSWLMVKVDRKN
ncbi:hypothetical protein K7432_005382 [Basidiobolus ranarum]|uniref:Uncharacterized protein n=1 Tax=Basidiobolus ranarum TaxID=34480 RepID=A0ABR2WWK9_9FUNG